MDFGFGHNGDNNTTDGNTPNQNGSQEDVTDLETGKTHSSTTVAPDDTTDLGYDSPNGGTQKTNEQPKPNTPAEPQKPAGQQGTDTPDDNGEQGSTIEAGTVVEVEGNSYTADANGNLLDKDGNIFKEAKDVADWIKTFDTIDNDGDENAISIQSIQTALGIDITGEDGNVIEFENTPAGVKAYVDSVIEAQREENMEAAINSLYQKYPIIEDVLNYYIANGNSIEGFNEVPDRSGIVIDDANVAQQESIIRTAWQEQGRRGDVDSYIQYLKSSGILAATAKDELKGLQDSDAEYKAEQAKLAEEAEQKHIETMQKYWNGVKEVVDSRSIAGYKIPETIIINKNGQKVSSTPTDFFNYIYQVDANGQSAYQKDLAKETPESRRDDEVLRAYLKFVGGNYSNLVDMAVNKQKVEKLILQSKNKPTSSVKITKPTNKPAAGGNVDVGYN